MEKFISLTAVACRFGSQWRIMPDYGIGVVAFANRTYAGVGAVNMQVLDTLIKIAGLKPESCPLPYS
jgi:hypothetical protein